MLNLSRGAWSRFLLPGDLELSTEAQDVLCRVFRPDPKKRIALAELRKHPWLTKGTSAKHAQGMPLFTHASCRRNLHLRPSYG